MRRRIPKVGALYERVRQPAILLISRVEALYDHVRRPAITLSNPRARALYERLRQPAITLLIALALVAPAGGLFLRGVPLPPPVPGSPVAVWHAGRSVIEAPRAEATDAGAAEPEAAAAEATLAPVTQAWMEEALERERREAAGRFAQEYGISEDLAEDIHAAASAEDIDPQVAFGLVKTESSFRRKVVSWAGAVGYTQLLPSTASWIAPGTSRSELFDTETNLRVGFKYLRYLLDKYDGNTWLALTAYNRGPGTVDRLLSRGRDPDNGYADKVLGD